MESYISPEALIQSLPRRHGASPVFEAARALQQEIAFNVVEEKELVDTWKLVQKVLGELNGEVEAENLKGLEVKLSGEGIKVPNVQTDIGAAALLSSIRDAPVFSQESLKEYNDAHELVGAFAGFTIDFVKNIDGRFSPKLAYQVATGEHVTPHLMVRIHATGPVDGTYLTFAEDEREDASVELALSLLEDCGPDYWNRIRLVREAAVSQEDIEASRLRHIAYHSQKVVNVQLLRPKLQSIEGKFTDLAALTIKAGSLVDVVANQAVQFINDKEIVHNGTVTLKVRNPQIAFRDEIFERGDSSELSGRRVLCLVSGTAESGIIYIPAHRIRSISNP